MPRKQDQENSNNGSESGGPSSKAIPFRSSDRPSRGERMSTPESPSFRIDRKRSATALNIVDDPEERVERNTEMREDGDGGDLTTSELCVCHSDPKIPRPRNAFILYRQHHASDVIAEFRGVSNPDVSKILGERWRNEPAEVKNEWKLLAEREKHQHQLQHPGYRYQPRRGGRRNDSIDSPTAASWTRCNKCGGRSMTSPTTPGSANPTRPSLPPPTPSTGGSGAASLPPMNDQFSSRRNSTRRYPPNITVPAPAHMGENPYDDRGVQLSPTSKRRRFTNVGFVPVNYQQPPVVTPHYNANTPFRGSFAYPDSAHRWPAGAQGMMPQPQRQPMQPPPTAHRDSTLTLPPLQTLGSSVEEVIMNMAFWRKIQVLGRITPPLKPPKLSSPPYPVRGTVIAVEGDNAHAVSLVMHWLEDFLGNHNEYSVKTAKGPDSPETGKDIQLTDYFNLINEWHNKAQEITKYITTPLKPPQSSGESKEALPVLLMQNYQLFASNVWACRTPKGEAYDPSEHWRWIASLWRGIVGPDLTIYVKDASPEEMHKSKQVEVLEELHAIVVRKEKGPGPVQGEVEGDNLRRLGFEVTERILKVSRLARPQGEQGLNGPNTNG